MFGELLRDNVWFGNQQMCIKPTLHIFKTAPCKWCFSLLRLPVYNTWTYVTQFGQNRLFLSWGAHSGLTAVSVCCTWRVVICQGDHCFCWVCNIYIHPVTVCVLFIVILKRKDCFEKGLLRVLETFYLSCDAMNWERGNAYCGSSNKYALLSSFLYYMIIWIIQSCILLGAYYWSVRRINGNKMKINKMWSFSGWCSFNKVYCLSDY